VSQTIQGRLWNRLDTDPEGRALAFYRTDGSYHWASFSQVVSEAAGTAYRLAELGIGPGAVVVIVLPSGEPAARMLLATLLLGGLPLLMAPPSLFGPNSDLTRTLHNTVRKAAARLVVAPVRMESRARDLRTGHPRTRFVFDDSGLKENAQSTMPRHIPDDADRLAAMQLTSGTTGLPRICTWRQPAVTAAVDGMVTAMRLTPDDVFLNWTPLYHDMGLVNNYLTCMLTGIPLVMMSPQDFVKTPALWLQALSSTGATTTWSPNFGFSLAATRAKEEELEGVQLEHVRGFWNAAEKIHLETMLAFQKRFAPYGLSPDALKTNYGCAENIGGATFTEPGRPFTSEFVDGRLLNRRRLARPASPDAPEAVPVVGTGKPHPGISISILSSKGRVLSDGQVGEIGLHTVSQMDGYLKDTAANRRALRDGLLRTGDLGYLRDGELFWVGRTRERINVRGRKFDPSDFEQVLFGIKGLRQGCFAAFGVDDERSGTERLVLVSEVAKAFDRAVAEVVAEIRQACLLNHGIGVEALLVPYGTLTKTSSGKRRHRHWHHVYESGELQALVLPSNP
jgi:acyl-CoA synthetase (AMP-forming)/AMP-acid ligase II